MGTFNLYTTMQDLIKLPNNAAFVPVLLVNAHHVCACAIKTSGAIAAWAVKMRMRSHGNTMSQLRAKAKKGGGRGGVSLRGGVSSEA